MDKNEFLNELNNYFDDRTINLAKIVLAVIEYDIKIHNELTNKVDLFEENNKNDKEEIVNWKDSILEPLQEVVLKLKQLGIIEEDLYETKKNVRYRLTNKNISVINEKLIEELRKYFKTSYCGKNRASSKEQVKNNLIKFLVDNPDKDIDKFSEIFKFYVDDKLEGEMSGMYVANIINFINSNKAPKFAGKDLKEYYEQYTTGSKSIFE